MALDHLVGDGGGDLVEVEMPRLLGHLRVVDRLEEEVAELSLQLAPCLPFDRVGNLVGFLDRVGRDRAEVLLDIPRTAGLGVAQARHDGAEPVHRGLVMHCGDARKGAGSLP
jgi:hypothetical protein